jgi:hypothetical protein
MYEHKNGILQSWHLIKDILWSKNQRERGFKMWIETKSHGNLDLLEWHCSAHLRGNLGKKDKSPQVLMPLCQISTSSDVSSPVPIHTIVKLDQASQQLEHVLPKTMI